MIMRRPTCNGTASPTRRPGWQARKKLVFDSIVDVRVPGEQVQRRGMAAKLVGKRHVRTAVDDAARVQVPVIGVDLADPLSLPSAMMRMPKCRAAAR